MKKVSILGEKYSHDISNLNLEELKKVNVNCLQSTFRRTKEIIDKFNDLKAMKEVVYSGRYYIK